MRRHTQKQSWDPFFEYISAKGHCVADIRALSFPAWLAPIRPGSFIHPFSFGAHNMFNNQRSNHGKPKHRQETKHVYTHPLLWNLWEFGCHSLGFQLRGQRKQPFCSMNRPRPTMVLPSQLSAFEWDVQKKKKSQCESHCRTFIVVLWLNLPLLLESFISISGLVRFVPVSHHYITVAGVMELFAILAASRPSWCALDTYAPKEDAAVRGYCCC